MSVAYSAEEQSFKAQVRAYFDEVITAVRVSLTFIGGDSLRRH